MSVINFAKIKSLFLENRSQKQTILKNSFWIYLGLGLRNVMAFVLIICITRILGVAEYGKFTFALSFVSLFSIICDFGIATILTRELSGEKRKPEEFYSIISLKIVLGLLMLILVFASSFFITKEPVIRMMILILAVYTFLAQAIPPIIYSFFQSRQKMEYQAWGETLTFLITTICALVFIFKIPTAQGLSYGYLTASLFSLILILGVFNFKVFPLKIAFNKSVWKKFLLMSWPLALTAMSSSLYTYMDSVMMGYWGQIVQVGWYSAAYRIVLATVAFTGILCACIFPAMSESFKQSKEKFQKIWDFQTEKMVIVTLPVVAGGIALAPRIISFIFGSEFAPSALALQILIIMGGAIILHDAFRSALIVSHQQKKIFWSILSGAIVNFILNLILIPKYSLYGAAVATVATQLLVFFLLLKFTVSFTSINPFKVKMIVVIAGAVISSAIMFLLISWPEINNLNILFSIPIGGLIYLICFLFYRKIINKVPAFKYIDIKIL